MSLARGTRLGPYEIEGALGAGGMGEIYKATDTRLGRAVAVKVVAAGLADDTGTRARFQREARALAAANHPNICALYDIGCDAGCDFLVMELLEGETLQQRLQRGPLDLPQLVDHAIALADALDAAHALGLIHRDLKPANVFLTSRGVPKILDFGLARGLVDTAHDVTRPPDEALTTLGTTAGTVAYMSPEQLRAEPLDVRTDLFSLGLVLYEMATGHRAFTGATSAVVSAAILGQEPAAPRSIRADLPDRLQETILKTLEKDRTLRCQTAAELRADLMRVRRQSGSDPMRSAVPPTPPPTALSGAAAAQAVDQSRRLESTPPPDPATPDAAAAPANVRGASPRLVASLWTAVALLLVGGAGMLTGNSWPFRGSREGPGGPRMSQPGPRASNGPRPADRPFDAPPPPGEREGPPQRGEPPPPPPPSQTNAPPGPRGGERVGPPRQEAAPAPAPDAAVGPPQGGEAERDGGPGRRGARGRAVRGVPTAGSTALVSALKTAPAEAFDLVFAANDPTARALAFQLRGALESAGWTCASTLEIAEPQTRFGIFAPHTSRGVTVLTNWALRGGFEPDIRLVRTLPRPRIVVGRQ